MNLVLPAILVNVVVTTFTTWHRGLNHYQYLALLLWGISCMLQKVVTEYIEYTVVYLE
jgi:hypothetical protein